MKKKLAIFLSLLIIVTLACNLSSSPSSKTPGETPQGNGNQPGNSPPPQPAGTELPPTPTGTPPANPVSINDGLGSLNSYQMTVISKSIGPDPTQSTTINLETQHSKDTDATHTHYSISVVKKGGGDPNNSESDMYSIGNDQCSGSGKDWKWTSYSPDEVEIRGLIKSMIGMTPLIENPTFVAQETVNSIPSNHFTFKVSGLGVKSGAEVKTNQGDYWLAVDGQYIVKYTLVVETSTDPQTNLVHEEISIELNQINQPVAIAFPQTCLDASKVTPTP